MFLLLIIATMSQYVQPQMGLYNLYRENTFCKNRGQKMQGELSVAETVELENLSGTIQGCAEVVYSMYQGYICSKVFFANSNQCACIRPGSECKEEQSETGFSVYQLTVLGKANEKVNERCKPLDQAGCTDDSACQWLQNSCVEIRLQSAKAFVGQPYGGAIPSVNPMAANAHGVPGQPMPGQPMPNTFLNGASLVRKDAECDREIDEVTGQSNIMPLQNAVSVQDCQAQAQTLFNQGVCTSYFVYQELVGFPSECTCVRAGGKYSICDVDDHRPGYTVYQLTTGGSMYPQGQFPNSQSMGHGAAPYTPGAPNAYGHNVPPTNGAYNTGYGPQNHMQPNMQPGAPYGGMPPNGMATNGYSNGMGVPPTGYANGMAHGMPQNGYSNGMGYGQSPQPYGPHAGHQFLSKSHSSEPSQTKPTSKWVVLAVLLTSFSVGVAIAYCTFHRVRGKNVRQTPMLLDEQNNNV